MVIHFIFGPVWLGNKPFREEEYYKQTIARLADIVPLSGKGELFAGYSQTELKLEKGQPIMGFSDRKPLESVGVLSPCYVKCLTLSAGGKKVSVVAVDIMLLMGDIITEIYKETGLNKDEVFFTATHTHSGYGGWVDHSVFELFYGKFSQKYYDRLKEAIVQTILKSRKKMQVVKMALVRVNAETWLENRIYKDEPAAEGKGYHKVNPFLTALSFVDKNNPEDILFVLTSFAAHATTVRKDIHEFSADYPGELCSNLKELTGAQGVMFAAGSVGDARATVLHYTGAQEMGVALAARLSKKILTAEYVEVESLTSVYLPVDLPQARFSFLSPKWGIFPLLAKYLFENPVHISYLQIGKFALAGMPADIAGELTAQFETEHPVVFTSFNGSWKGYFTREDTYLHRDTYSTRTMGLSGAQAGEFVVELTERLYEKYSRK